MSEEYNTVQSSVVWIKEKGRLDHAFVKELQGKLSKLNEREQHCLEIGNVNLEIEDKYLKMNHNKIARFYKNNGEMVQDLT